MMHKIIISPHPNLWHSHFIQTALWMKEQHCLHCAAFFLAVGKQTVQQSQYWTTCFISLTLAKEHLWLSGDSSAYNKVPSRCRADTALNHLHTSSEPPAKESKANYEQSFDCGSREVQSICREAAISCMFENTDKWKSPMDASLALKWLTGTCYVSEVHS